MREIKLSTEFSGKLYLGDYWDANNMDDVLATHNIKSILNVGCVPYGNPGKYDVKHYLHVPHSDFGPFQELEKCHDFMYNALMRGNLFVHCIAGVNRSPSMVLTFLIKYDNLRNYEEGLDRVKPSDIEEYFRDYITNLF